MTLSEMSERYTERAVRIHGRITELRRQARLAHDPETVIALQRRVAALLPLWQEARELARLTAHYYDNRRSRE